MSKVKKITVSNLKAVSKMSADFNGCTAIITGGNNKGKSTFLRSLPDRLRGLKPEVVLKNGEKDGFAEWELTTGEKFVWTFDGKKEKLTFISERNIPQSVTKDLSTVYFPPVFDVDEFLNSTPKKQKQTLQKLTGIDFTEFDKMYQEAYEARTYANKRRDEQKAKLVYYDPKLPLFEESTEELEKKISGAEAHNMKYKTVVDKINDRKTSLVDVNSRIEDLEEQLKKLKEQKDAITSDISKGEMWCAEKVNQPVTDIDQLREEVKKIKEENLKITKNNEAKELQDEYDKAVKNAEAADAEVKRIEAEKMDVIKNASMPEGFGFSEEGITYNGLAFNKETLSSSGIYIAALKLAALNLGEVKCLHFDASFLDKKSLQEIEDWAQSQDLQLLIERPDFEGGEIEYQIVSTNEA